MASGPCSAGLYSWQAGSSIASRTRRVLGGCQKVDSWVRRCWGARAVDTVCARASDALERWAADTTQASHQGWPTGCRLPLWGLQRSDAQVLDQRKLRRGLSQAAYSPTALSSGLFPSAASQVAGSRWCRSSTTMAWSQASCDQKKVAESRGGRVFEDEASFWLDGTLHQTWSEVGTQPRVPTYGLRKTAHVFGAVAVQDASFVYQFADIFNGHTFHEFLLTVVKHYARQKVFMVIDNGPCHWLDEAGKRWLAENLDKIELFRLIQSGGGHMENDPPNDHAQLSLPDCCRTWHGSLSYVRNVSWEPETYRQSGGALPRSANRSG